MNITMPKCGYDIPVPEPDPKQPEENISNEIIIPADISSEDDDDNDEDDAPENHGYQALSSEVPNDDESSDEEEVMFTNEVPPSREICINHDLVRNAMKNISIDVSCIPPWAKDISEAAWKDVVTRAITKGGSESGATLSSDKPQSSQQLELNR